MNMAPQAFQTPRMGLVNRHNYERLGYQRLLRGVYQQAGPADDDAWSAQRATWRRKVAAVMALYADHDPVLYGPSALQMLSVALPHTVADWQAVHVLVSNPGWRPNRQDVVAHCTSRPIKPWRQISGIPVLHPVDHWLQTAGASVDAMVEIGDGFLRRKNPLLSLEDMTARLDQLKGVRRFGLAKQAMRLVRANTDSLYETRTRLMLVHAKLPTPEVNYPVWCQSIDFTYHVDMGYPSVKVAVEYDGLGHVQDREQMSIDANRRRDLQDEGWLVITVTADQLRRPSAVVRSVESALHLRGWMGRRP